MNAPGAGTTASLLAAHGAEAAWAAAACTAALVVSHTAACVFVAYMDLHGGWAALALERKRAVTWATYVDGLQSFWRDMAVMFLPFMWVVMLWRAEEVLQSEDAWWLALAKMMLGVLAGHLWTYVVHLALHSPVLAHLHKKHHACTRELVASKAWVDSWQEFVLMELPGMALTPILFPTQTWAIALQLAWYGVGAASDHCGLRAPPGILGWFVDGEYHFYHHKLGVVNFAEFEVLDLMMGTHHTCKLDHPALAHLRDGGKVASD